MGGGQLEALRQGAAAAEGGVPQHSVGALGGHWPGGAPLAATGHRLGTVQQPRVAALPQYAALLVGNLHCPVHMYALSAVADRDAAVLPLFSLFPKLFP